MSILSAFNNHLLEFLEDVSSIFPEDKDIKKAKSALEILKKANPRAIILIWKSHITDLYGDQIDNGDITFFVNKDYSFDVQGANSANKILDAVNRLRDPVKNMGADNQQKTMKYIQNLTKLSRMYT
jgi:hypothetical protein